MQISDATTAKRIKVDQYCQRQRCKDVELEQFLACFRVERVCQRQLGFLVQMRAVSDHIKMALRTAPVDAVASGAMPL